MSEQPNTQEPTLKDLDPRLVKQVQNADQSIARGNANYAIDICQNILKTYPGCVDVRKVLRKAQQKIAASKGKSSKVLKGVTNAPFLMKASSQIKKEPLNVMETAEKLLNADPTNLMALKLLGQAALEAGFAQTTIHAYTCIRELDAQNIENLLALGEVYLSIGKTKEAVACGDAIQKFQPSHGGAQDLIRRASVSQTIEQGHWEDKGADFRSKLKDEDQAIKLEQQARVANDEETLTRLIGETYEQIQKQPENINHYRRIADYYRKMNDFQNAGAWIAHARTLPTGAADSTLEELQVELYTGQLEKEIEEKQAALAADPANDTLPGEIQAWQQALHDYKMATARERVDRYPNNYEYRYDLGELLLAESQYDEAVKQFQFSQRNPKVRHKSLLQMALAFKATQKWPLAVDQLSVAKKEMLIMDDKKKAVLYELADAYELMGKVQEAYEEFKELYQADIGYRDVSDRFNSIYAQLNQG